MSDIPTKFKGDVNWVANVFELDFDAGSDLLNTYTEGYQITTYRIKYLDQEDIESLGFNYFKEYKQNNNNKRFLIEKRNKEFWITKLEKENYYTIEKVKYGETYGGVIEYFKGIIKNISELKVLLTQIGVGYD